MGQRKLLRRAVGPGRNQDSERPGRVQVLRLKHSPQNPSQLLKRGERFTRSLGILIRIDSKGTDVQFGPSLPPGRREHKHIKAAIAIAAFPKDSSARRTSNDNSFGRRVRLAVVGMRF